MTPSDRHLIEPYPVLYSIVIPTAILIIPMYFYFICSERDAVANTAELLFVARCKRRRIGLGAHGASIIAAGAAAGEDATAAAQPVAVPNHVATAERLCCGQQDGHCRSH